MNKKLQTVTKEWMELERKTAEQRKKADRYYDEHLMDLIRDDYIKRNTERIPDNVDYLIVSVGTSYEPIVLNLSLLSPKKTLFLYTEKSESILDKAIDYCKFKASDYEKRLINEVDPNDVYSEIKSAYMTWNKPARLFIDFTGGTKAMSAAAALAGAMIDVTMLYVASNNYLVDFRKPCPGSEILIVVDNPISVFGDLEIEKATDQYELGDFSGAADKFEDLANIIPDPVMRQELQFRLLLTRSYEAWDSLDFENAYKNMNELIQQIDRDKRCKINILPKLDKVRLTSQRDTLEILSDIGTYIADKRQQDVLCNKDMISALQHTMEMNALTREQQQKYDMATLLWYRLLEMIEQRRLSVYNLFVSDMHYDEVSPDLKQTPEMAAMSPTERIEYIRNSVISIKKTLFKGRVSTFLPTQISLLEGYIMLAVLKDPILGNNDKERIRLLSQVRARVVLRNNSIFAHGLGPVKKEDYMKFRDFVEEMFDKYCEIENIDHKSAKGIYQWISIKEDSVCL